MSLHELDLNLLWVLDAVLRERSVTRAAQKIGMTQPAMSKALRRLRGFFQDELLVRAKGEAYLTPLALDLVEPLAETLRVLERTMERRPSFDPSRDQRVFRIAAHDTVMLLVLHPFIQQISACAPGISLEIRTLDGRRTVEQIERGEIDMGIWPSKVTPDLVKEVLFEDRLTCAVWKGNSEVGDRLSLEQYLAMNHIAYAYRAHDMTGFLRLQQTGHPEANLKVTLDSDAMRLLLLRGTSLALMASEKLANLLRDAAEIRLVEPPFETEALNQSMYWHPRSTNELGHCWLRETLLGIASRLNVPQPWSR